MHSPSYPTSDPGASAEGAVGYWPLDGSATDSSGNGNNGTLENNPTWVSGKIGQALNCDGTSRVNVPDSSTLDLTGGNIIKGDGIATFNMTGGRLQSAVHAQIGRIYPYPAPLKSR